MAQQPNSLIWFRSDLRLGHQPALRSAVADAAGIGGGGRVVGLFVISPSEWAAHDMAGVRVDFLLRTLRQLAGALEQLGIGLLVRRAESAADVPGLVIAAAREHACSSVHFNREYEIDEARRDERVMELGASAGLTIHAHHDQCVIEPGALRTQSGTVYTVFTPFRRAWCEEIERRGGLKPLAAPTKKDLPTIRPAAPVIGGEAVPDSVVGFATSVPASLWPAGEREAQRRLEGFLEQRAADYKVARDLPALDGTSVLSPYLAVGAISTAQCVAAAIARNRGQTQGGIAGLDTWISELCWRDFYRHIAHAFPRVCMGRAFKRDTERIAWRSDPEAFGAWCEGRTGFPIVDAGMRQLAATGWMHNRLRMIAAMFLTKDLLIDWRLGERFFMRHLIDGDLASNNGGWQWSASTGTDAAPYFRVFNPTSQSERCDPEGRFIRRWVPELSRLEGDAIHEPERLGPLARATLAYPRPIVDHAMARRRVLEAFARP